MSQKSKNSQRKAKKQLEKNKKVVEEILSFNPPEEDNPDRAAAMNQGTDEDSDDQRDNRGVVGEEEEASESEEKKVPVTSTVSTKKDVATEVQIVGASKTKIFAFVSSVTETALREYLNENVEVKEVKIDEKNAQMWAYDGFDPLKALKIFAFYSQGMKKEEWEPDLINLLFIYVTRGSRIMKIADRTSITGKRSMQNLFMKYKIHSTSKTKKLGNLILTLPRLSTGFPVLTARILYNDIVSVPVVVPGLPKIYAWPGGLSLIQQADAANKRLWMQWSRQFTKLISIGETPTDAEIDAKNAPFYRVMENSKFISEKQKADLFTALGAKVGV